MKPFSSYAVPGYTGLLLVLASVLAPLPYSAATVVLLVGLVVLWRRRPAGPWLGLALAVVVLLPLALEGPLGAAAGTGWLSSGAFRLGPLVFTPAAVVAVVACLPVLLLLDGALAGAASRVLLAGRSIPGRTPTRLTYAVLVVALGAVLAAFVVLRPVLFLAGAVLLLYLGVSLLRAGRAVPPRVIAVAEVTRRVLAGETVRLELRVASRSGRAVLARVDTGQEWLKVTPARFGLDAAGTVLAVTVTPPLAGPARPALRFTVTDLRGLLCHGEVAGPVTLEVIPRARYAEWLARRYLEQTGGGAAGVEAFSAPAQARRHGTEYLDSRAYQPGDELRRIDWKHTIKLGELTVKEFVEAGGQTAILAVDLVAATAEEADRLAYDAITTTLTLARENIPVALAAYDEHDVVLASGVLVPEVAVAQALRLVKSIRLVPLPRRYLQPADAGRLRRSLALLGQAESRPARLLHEVLQLEYRGLEEAARGSPAARALARVTRNIPLPAAVVLISHLNHNAGVISVLRERLQRRGFSFTPLDSLRR